MRMFALLLLMTSVAFAVDEPWQNTLKPSGETGPALTIVDNGQAKYSIATPANPTGPEKKAAEDLQHWIEGMTGAKLPIETKPKGHAIYIETDKSFPGEQYRINIEHD